MCFSLSDRLPDRRKPADLATLVLSLSSQGWGWVCALSRGSFYACLGCGECRCLIVCPIVCPIV